MNAVKIAAGVVTGVALLLGTAAFVDSARTDARADAAQVSAPARVVPPVQPAVVAEPVDTDAVFLLTVRAYDGQFAAVPDETLTGLAHSVCGALDRGNSLVDVITAANASNLFDASTNGYLIGASIAAYCPSHKPTA